MAVTITLAWYEFAAAANVGLTRFTHSEAMRREANRYSGDPGNWSLRVRNDIGGAAAELAFCKWRGLYWEASVNTFHSIADAGQIYEVRYTERADGRLIVRPVDDDNRWYVLVTGTAPTLTIHGAIKGAAAKRDVWQRQPNGDPPAWFVSSDALIPAAVASSVPP